MSDPSTEYDDAFFAWHDQLKPFYTSFIEKLYGLLNPTSLIDLGCGNGFFVEWFSENTIRKEYAAVEGSYNALRHIRATKRSPGWVYLADLRLPVVFPRKYDLSICVEVAEHLPEESADTLVNNIFNASNNWVLFSGATPGQGGYSHINEQPHDYWVRKFETRLFSLDKEKTAACRSYCGSELSWLRDNAMIFKFSP